MTERAQFVLRKGAGRSLKAGGSWVYDNEIEHISGEYENGGVVDVLDFDGYPMGSGFVNDNSAIRIRMLSRDPSEVPDDDFFRSRIKAAWDYRKKVIDTSSCRLVFGEADGLPGLVVDKYEDVLVMQVSALGMDRIKARMADLVREVLGEDGVSIRGIYERSDGKYRDQEGIPRVSAFMGDKFDTSVIITENNVKYYVDIEKGQKTGFFLDQKLNRAAVGKLAEGSTVLDCFTHTGSFALNCGRCGAKSVLGVDASADAVSMARKNAELNGLSGTVSFMQDNVLDLLPKLAREGAQYDMVILDPPAFTKSRNSIKAAMKGYREINMKALRVIRPGGFLATCSCSHFMDLQAFTAVISQAAASAHRRLRQVELRTQAPDHPVLWGSDETFYLKFYIFQVI